MNAIVHAYVILELFKNDQLSVNERDNLIIGSIFPDFESSKLISSKQTHYDSLNFLKIAKNNCSKYFALGMALHGERPKGLDYYTHQKGGFIDKNVPLVEPIAKKYKRIIGKSDSLTIHNLIEFSADNIYGRENRDVVELLIKAADNKSVHRSIREYCNHLNLKKFSTSRLIYILKHPILKKFIRNFTSVITVSKSWAKFIFLHNLKLKDKHTLSEKIKIISNFSFNSLKRKIHNKILGKMFEEINLKIEDNVEKFIKKVITKMRPLKNELKRNIC
jgi:hypothetical protein